MPQIRTIKGAADEIKKVDPNTAITEYRIRLLVNEISLPSISVGNRKLVNMDDVWDCFKFKVSKLKLIWGGK